MKIPDPHAKLWLFDFDNTLAALEREVDWAGSRRELEAYLRAECVEPAIFAEIPKGNLPLYAALHSRWLRRSPESGLVATRSLDNAEALLRRASEIIERYELLGADRAAPTPGAIDLLRALAARDAVAVIVTSNSSRTVARWLDRHGVSNLVRAILGRDSLLALKPSPEMVDRAIALAASFASNALKPPSASDTPASVSATDARATLSAAHDRATASAAVFVGDSLADFDAASAAGLDFFGIAANDADRDRLLSAGVTNLFASPSGLRIHLNLTLPDLGSAPYSS